MYHFCTVDCRIYAIVLFQDCIFCACRKNGSGQLPIPFSFKCACVIVYSVPPPPKDVPTDIIHRWIMSPGHYSLVNIVPLGHYSPVNNVPPQWILSPLEQGSELSSAEISTSRWVYSFIYRNKQVIWSCFTSHTGLRDYGAYCVLYAVSPRLLPWLFLPQHLPLAVLTQGKKPELVLLLPWIQMTNTGREGLGTRLKCIISSLA